MPCGYVSVVDQCRHDEASAAAAAASRAPAASLLLPRLRAHLLLLFSSSPSLSSLTPSPSSVPLWWQRKGKVPRLGFAADWGFMGDTLGFARPWQARFWRLGQDAWRASTRLASGRVHGVASWPTGQARVVASPCRGVGTSARGGSVDSSEAEWRRRERWARGDSHRRKVER